MNGTTTIAEFRDAVLDPAKRAHYRLAWLSTVDHKRIAVLYMLTALVFFVIGGTEALFMRLQLAVPNNHFLHPDTFNQLFTMHGTTMIFLVVMPVVIRPRKLHPAICKSARATWLSRVLMPLVSGACRLVEFFCTSACSPAALPQSAGSHTRP